MVSTELYKKQTLQTVFYPVYGIIIVGELFFYLDGYTQGEYGSVVGEDDEAYRIVNYSLLRKFLRSFFKDKLLAENGDFVTYGGVVNFNKTTETLKDYFAMLFPTYYHGEGFPGTVIDAYNAALPMIATRWNYNADVIEDGVNGILVPIKDAEAMCNALLELYNDRDRAYEIAMNNLNSAEQYTPDRVLAKFYEFLDAEK